MKKNSLLFLSFVLSCISFSFSTAQKKPYDIIGEKIKQNSTSIVNPVYKIPCGTVNLSTYLQSAISVGEAVTAPICYFSPTVAPGYYVNTSQDIATVERGKNFTLVLTSNKNTATTDAYVYVFADWDRDGVFETVLGQKQITNLTTNETPGVKYEIAIPAGAALGKNRIRVYFTKTASATLTPTDAVSGGFIYDLMFFVKEVAVHEGLLVAASSNNPNWGAAVVSTVSPTNDGRYPTESTVTLQAVPATNVTFIGWSDGTQIISTSENYSFKITEPTYLIAVFKLPTATLEAPQTSTAENPIWYQIKNAQTDIRLNTFIAYTAGSSSGYDIHIEKPEDFTNKFLWRLETSADGMVKIINKGSNMQIYATGAYSVAVTPSATGSDFFVTPSGNANGSYSIQYNKESIKLLNADPSSKLLLYNGGLGTGSGWYFYRLPMILSSSKPVENSTIQITVSGNELTIDGIAQGDAINIYNLLGHTVLRRISSGEKESFQFAGKGIFIATVSDKNGYKNVKKILK